MKLLSLTIENIASIEKARIDFDQPPLADPSIFLICGETGAGKTTILNAMTLALYNQVPYQRDIHERNNNRDSDGLSISDPRQLLRRGAMRAEVQLSFIGNDDHRYVATWSVHRARQAPHKPQPVTRAVSDLTTGIETVKSGVQDVINDAVGLTFDEFCRTTMLAQGAFAAFLKGTSDEKASILEKLTRTEHYTQVGKEIFRRMSATNEKVRLLEAEIKGVGLLSDDERAQMATLLADTEAAMSLKGERHSAFASRLKALTERLSLTQRIDAHMTEARSLHDVMSSERYVAEQRQIDNWNKTEQVRSDISLRDKAEGDIRRLVATQKEQKKTLDTLLARVHGLEQAVERGRLRLRQLTDESHTLDPFAPWIENESRVKAELQTIADGFDILAQCNIAEQSLSEARRRLDEYGDIGALQTKQRTLSDACTHLQQAIAANDKVLEATPQTTNLRRTLEQYSTQRTALVAEHDTLKASLAEDDKKVEALRNRYEGQRDLRNTMISVRRRFSEDHHCPLCGSEVPHLHTDEVMDQAVDTAQQQLTEAEEQSRTTRRAIEANEERTKVYDSLIADTTRILAEDNARLASLQAEADKANARVDVAPDSQREAYTRTLDEAERARIQLEQAIQWQRAVDALRRRRGAVEYLNGLREGALAEPLSREAVTAIAQQFDDISTRHRQLATQTDKVSAALTDIENRASRCRGTIDELRRIFTIDESPSIDPTFGDIDKDLSQFATKALGLDGQITAVRRQLTEHTDAVRAYFASADAVTLDEMQALIVLGSTGIQRLQKEHDERKEQVDKVQGALETLRAQLAAVVVPDPIDGEGDDPIAIRPLVEALEAEVKQLSEQCVALRTRLADDEANRTRVAATKATLEQQQTLLAHWRELNDMFGGADGKCFRTVAQIHVLHNLLVNANRYLEILYPRYELRCGADNLNIYVHDHRSNGADRVVNSLSGGEGFLASLALALGLSAIGQNSLHVDTLFIDEGFGTLSEEPRRDTIAMFERLYKWGGRRVGIISHIKEMQDYLGTRITVKKRPGNPSISDVVISQD